jgi:hypothetical protein
LRKRRRSTGGKRNGHPHQRQLLHTIFSGTVARKMPRVVADAFGVMKQPQFTKPKTRSPEIFGVCAPI